MRNAIAVMNTKGGVGKSTLVLAMAETLSARFGKNVLVIDTDAQASVSLMLLSAGNLNQLQLEGLTIVDLLVASVLKKAEADYTRPARPRSRPRRRPRAATRAFPSTTRDRTSRPMSSVPNQCAAEGALRIALQLVSIGSNGASHGASSAAATNKATTTSPIIAPRRRAQASPRHRSQGARGGGGAARRRRRGRSGEDGGHGGQARSFGLAAK